MELEKQIRLAGRVDSVIQKGMQEGKITGACVGIYQNQEEYLCKAYGLADREQETPMRTDTAEPFCRAGKIRREDPWYFTGCH